MQLKLLHKRGAPLGNQNALKHGFYSRALNKTDQLDLDLAAGISGVTEEIALLRFEIKKAVTSGDVAKLVPLSKAAFALEKLIRTNHKFFVERHTRLQDAVKNAIRSVLLPLGPDAIRSVITANYPDMLPPDINSKSIQKSNDVQNEAN
jgi:hypothetical protein